MPYLVTSTERNNQTASEFETKALLYLIMSDTGNNMEWFVVDFFNDVSAIDAYATKIWDVQSKGTKEKNARQIGQSMVTLFKNYLSDFEFVSFVLFSRELQRGLRNDELNNIFNYTDFTALAQVAIKKGLIAEAKKKKYISNDLVSDENVDSFLTKVTIVISDQNKAKYVKAVLESEESLINDKLFEAIFDEIRDYQTGKKNKNAEGVRIEKIIEALDYKKNFTKEEILKLVILRIIEVDLMKATPVEFVQQMCHYNHIEMQDLLEKCRMDLARVFFDKNNKGSFWKLFSEIYAKTKSNFDKSLDEIYELLDKSKIKFVRNLNCMSIRFFIALIKGKIKNEN